MLLSGMLCCKNNYISCIRVLRYRCINDGGVTRADGLVCEHINSDKIKEDICNQL